MTGVDFLAALIHYVTFFHFFLSNPLPLFSMAVDLWHTANQSYPIVFSTQRKNILYFPKKTNSPNEKKFLRLFWRTNHLAQPKKISYIFRRKKYARRKYSFILSCKNNHPHPKKKHIFQTQLTSCNYQKKHFSNKEFLTLA